MKNNDDQDPASMDMEGMRQVIGEENFDLMSPADREWMLQSLKDAKQVKPRKKKLTKETKGGVASDAIADILAMGESLGLPTPSPEIMDALRALSGPAKKAQTPSPVSCAYTIASAGFASFDGLMHNMTDAMMKTGQLTAEKTIICMLIAQEMMATLSLTGAVYDRVSRDAFLASQTLMDEHGEGTGDLSDITFEVFKEMTEKSLESVLTRINRNLKSNVQEVLGERYADLQSYKSTEGGDDDE